MITKRKNALEFIGASLLASLLVWVTISISSCAELKQVLRTVDDIAEAACTIFGTNHPDEFRELVRHTKPALAPKVDKPSFNVKELCSIKEVVQPFIDDQLKLQKRTALMLHLAAQRRTSGGDAALEGVVQRDAGSGDGGPADASASEQ